MVRVVVALAVIPFLLVALLAGAMGMQAGKLGSLTFEIFELGFLPLVVFAGLVLLLVFLPLLLLVSRFAQVSLWNSMAVGFVSVLLPVVFSAWSFLGDGRLRLNYRVERLAENYPWLAMGAVGGLLFWLLAVYRNCALSGQKKP